MRPDPSSRFNRRLKLVAATALAMAPAFPGWAADIDIYGPTAAGGAPNVMFLLDNTSNWSANNQAWSKSSVDAKCNAQPLAASRTQCLAYSTQIFAGQTNLEQGRVQLRALKLVLNELVCSDSSSKLNVNVGLSMMASQSTLNNGHGVGVINSAVQPLAGTATTSGSSCKALIDKLDTIDAQITEPDYKAPSSANYGAALYEIFKYYGGHTNPTLASSPEPNGASPTGATGYGPGRFSKSNALDDQTPLPGGAFADAGRTTYRSPITAANSCGNNYVVLVGNAYPNVEPNNGGPTIFSGLNYTPPALSTVTSDTSRLADEWSYFLSNTDVSAQPGVQRVFTYTINTYNDKPDADQGRLLKSMAAVGGIGASGYIEVGGDLLALVNGFKDILTNIASVDSVFTAVTLPVSTTTQGTFLNQIYVGMFRPDGNGSPRWVGNLKQYQLGFIDGTLDLLDKNKRSAVAAGFFNATSDSFWTENSVFFDQLPSGTPASASDRPDGAMVDKGGAAQQLRKRYEKGAALRNVKTLSATGVQADFLTSTSGLSADVVNWARGEANNSNVDGREAFTGSYRDTNATKLLGATGARHSIHGDVLHSRPVALNYGNGDVVVYYGANDGFLRAVNGNQANPISGHAPGQEIWSFVSRDHYPLLTRLRNGTPTLHLPETNSSGGLSAAPAGKAAKDYAMDGPIGVYARYTASGAVSAATIYATMRRGGRSVYAIDVSDKTTPGYLWKITGGTGSYVKLAQTWSMPKAVVFNSTEARPPVLIMGGGYDVSEDSNNAVSGDNNSGRAVYIINAADGSLIKELPTEFSVPSDVTVVDVDGNGEPDRAYVADVRGGLYRIDFPKSGNRTLASTWSDISAVKIASLGGKVFFAPDVVVTKNFVAVLAGTGDREKPLLNATADRFVMIKDSRGPRTSDTVLAISDLAEVASVSNATMTLTPATTPPISENGCFLNLATNGEKVINAPLTIAGATYFGTNRPPPPNSSSCSASLGEAYAYKFPLFCGMPAKPNQIIGGGLLPSPVGGIVTILVDGKPTQVPVLIGGGEGNSGFKPVQPKPPIPPIRTRQNWRIDNSNR